MDQLDKHQGEKLDPVCGMKVDSKEPGALFDYKNERFYFCGELCRDEFIANPELILHPPAQADLSVSDRERTYTCPMHSQILQKGPGSCPICGMALEPLEVSIEDEGPNLELIIMTKRFWWGVAFSVPLLILTMSDLFPGMPVSSHIPISWLNWIQFALATPVVFWSGFPLFVLFSKSLQNKSPNMFTLIGLGTGVAYIYSLAATFLPWIFPGGFKSEHGQIGVYFEASAVIVTLVLLGQVLELKARSSTSSAIRSLLKLAPKTARRIGHDGSEVDVEIGQIHLNDLLRVRPGEKVPVDGAVLEGESSIDESMITGESIPVNKVKGAQVSAGTLNGTGSFVMTAERIGADTLLSQIVKMVSEAQRSRAPIQALADRVSSYFVPAVILVALITASIWALLGPEPKLAYAVVNAVAVLIIACPCTLGLATPMSIMVGTGKGAQNGVLIKNAEALQTLEKIDTLVVDKTGTLTGGRPVLVSVVATEYYTENEILSAAASLEKGSEHPLASAILSGAKFKNLPYIDATDFKSVSGKGITGKINGRLVILGNSLMLESSQIKVDQALSQKAEALRADGQTVMFLAIDGKHAGLVGVADTVKASSGHAIQLLKDMGIETIMLTGDNQITAQAVANLLGITQIRADVLPDQKASVIRELQKSGRFVAMAGDGVNDAPALAQAQVGIAMGTGTDVAIQSAGITLLNGDLLGIVKARHLSQATMRNIRQNLFFAFFYNALGVPLAAGVLYPFVGILLSPMIASAAMSLSSVSVIGNALRLRNVRI